MSDSDTTKKTMSHEAMLGELRRDIDEIDAEIVQLLCERYDTVHALSKHKRALGLPLENKEREKQVLVGLRAEAVDEYSRWIEQVFKSIIGTSKALQRGCTNLYFIGMPNCGKNKFASRIGGILSMPHTDTDELVMERCGKSIDRIFDEDGEPAFREAESAVLEELAYRGGTVAATGGGIITVERNIKVLKNSGFVVFLDRSIDGLVRAKIRNRPLIRQGSAAVTALYRERIDIYRSTADLTVDPDAGGSISAVIRAYKHALRQI